MNCPTCGDPFTPNPGRGRPRTHCGKRKCYRRKPTLEPNTGFLYLIELADSVIKVGVTTDLRSRFAQHRRDHGEFVRSWVSEEPVHLPYMVERRTVEILTGFYGYPVVRGLEYLRGDFDVTMTIIHTILDRRKGIAGPTEWDDMNPTDRELFRRGISEAVNMIPGRKYERCAMLEVSPVTLDRWTQGAGTPSPENLARLCMTAGVDESFIRSGGSLAHVSSNLLVNR